MILLLPLAEAAEFRSVDEVLAQFKNEPAVAQVQAMVLEYSKTDNRYVDAWHRAARTAAALPEFQVTYDYDNKYRNDFDYVADALSYSSAYGEAERDLQLRAKWKLDELVMSSDRIRVISETQDIVKLRDKVLDEVTRLYFDRRRLQVDILLGGTADLRTQLKNELRLQELTAQLDAYTGQRFSAAVRSR